MVWLLQDTGHSPDTPDMETVETQWRHGGVTATGDKIFVSRQFHFLRFALRLSSGAQEPRQQWAGRDHLI